MPPKEAEEAVDGCAVAFGVVSVTLVGTFVFVVVALLWKLGRWAFF